MHHRHFFGNEIRSIIMNNSSSSLPAALDLKALKLSELFKVFKKSGHSPSKSLTGVNLTPTPPILEEPAPHRSVVLRSTADQVRTLTVHF